MCVCVYAHVYVYVYVNVCVCVRRQHYIDPWVFLTLTVFTRHAGLSVPRADLHGQVRQKQRDPQSNFWNHKTDQKQGRYMAPFFGGRVPLLHCTKPRSGSENETVFREQVGWLAGSGSHVSVPIYVRVAHKTCPKQARYERYVFEEQYRHEQYSASRKPA